MEPPRPSRRESANKKGEKRSDLTPPRARFPLSLQARAAGLAVAVVLHKAVDRLVGIVAPSVDSRGKVLIRKFAMAETDAEDDGDIGPLLSETDAPGLIELVASTATRMGAAIPRDVRLSCSPSCGVMDFRAQDGKEKKALIVGLPCFDFLSIRELTAVLGHEFAHLRLNDGALTQGVVAYSYALWERSSALAENERCGIRTRLEKAAGGWMVKAAAPICQAMEFRADRLAADWFGAKPLAAAIERLAIAQRLFGVIAEDFNPLDRPKDNVFAAFEAQWRGLDERQLERLREVVVEQNQSDPTDRHPSAKARIDRLRQLPPGREDDRVPASTLLSDIVAVRSLLHQRIFGARRRRSSVFTRARR